MITIAGREVKKDDELYHVNRARWGVVIGIDEGSVILRIPGQTSDDYIDMHVTQGGNVNGRHTVYWHPPLVLDLPQKDVTRVQRYVDFCLAEMARGN